MERLFAITGAISGLLAVGFGAFGAHGLRGKISDDLLHAYEVGAHYHLIHALALIAVAWAITRWPGGAMQAAGWLFLAGTLLFSGSLYLLAVTGIRPLGMVTPVGGTCLMMGWGCFAWSAFASKTS
jgi:uncharacterized membrane protein YgdD (TMEM256/DUF423 family)